MRNQIRFEEIFSVVVLPVLKAHNEGARRAKRDEVSVEVLQQKLADESIFTTDSLNELSFEDWQRIGLPNALAKSVAKKVRSEVKDADPKSRSKGRSRFYSLWSFDELLEDYRPEEIGSRVASEINKRMKADNLSAKSRVFVFLKNGKLDTAKTLELLKGARQGDPDLEFTKATDGSRQRTYRCGESPNQIASEHPLDSNSYLRSDGTGEDGFNWGNVSTEANQLLRLAVESEEIDVDFDDREKLATLYDRASGDNGFATLSAIYPQAAARFHELQEIENLPKLISHRKKGKSRKPRSDARSVLS